MIRFGKPRIETGSGMDKQVLDDSFAAMEAAKAELKDGGPNPWSFLLASKMMRLAAAALIIVAIGFVIVHQAARRQIDGQTFTDAAKSPGEMMTAMSLERAFRRGGIEAVEEQCKRAFKPLGLQPRSLSVEQILAEFDGENPEGKRL
jgi:hypothetical protein